MDGASKIRTSIFASACLLLTLFLTLPLNAQRTIRIEYNREAGVGCPSNPEWESWIGVSIGLTPPSCIDTTHFSGTSAQKEVVARAGESFYVGAHTVSSTVGTSYVDVYLDGVLIGHYENYRNPPPTTLCIGGFEGGIFQFGSDLTISTTNSSVPHGDSTSFSHTVPTTPCTTPMWYTGLDSVSISIDSPGTELGHLRLGSSGPLVDSLKVLAVDIPNVKFVADGRQPHGATESVTVEASVPAAGITAQTSFAVACNLQPDTFRQNQSPWGTDRYDNHPDSLQPEGQMRRKGCATTSLAMALTAFGNTIDPRQLNNWMRTPRTNGDYNGYSGRDVWWSQIDNSNPYGVTTKRLGKSSFKKGSNWLTDTTLTSEIDAPLNNCKLVIVQVYNPVTDNQHWVLVTKKLGTGNYSIIDPNSDITSLSYYRNRFWGYVTVGLR